MLRLERAQEHVEKYKVKYCVNRLSFVVPRADSFSVQVMGPPGLPLKVSDNGISLFRKPMGRHYLRIF